MYNYLNKDNWLYLHIKCNVEGMTSHYDCV